MTFSGRRARELGQEVVFVTERCVIRLLPDGLTVTEIAPGISLTRDIVGQTSLDLRISPDLHEMDARLFQPGADVPEAAGADRHERAPTPDQTLLVSLDGPVATITLNRPEKLNALTLPMLSALDDALLTIDADDAVRVVVITGSGVKAFSAGADVVAWSSLAPLDMWRTLDAHGSPGHGAARGPPPADDRRPQRDRLRRRARARPGLRSEDRRGAT